MAKNDDNDLLSDAIRYAFRAAKHGDWIKLKEIVASDTRVLECLDSDGLTLLMQAARAGNVESIHLLLECGMDIDTRNEDGWSALRFAARCQNREAAQFLSDHGAKSDIFVAAALGDKQAVENSLKLQPDLVFANDGYGAQPLHWAAEFSYPELVDLLLQVGAKAKSSDHWGSTALHFTAQKGRDGCVEVATLLLDHGAKIDALDHDGKTPLHLAVRRRRLDLVKFLLARGARARTQDKTLGCTPLHSAVERANEDALPSISVLELLLRAGADVNVRNEFGETPLGVALRCEQTQIADFLRQRGGIE